MYQGETKDLRVRNDKEMGIQGSKWEERWRAEGKRKRQEQQECLTHADTDPKLSQSMIAINALTVKIRYSYYIRVPRRNLKAAKGRVKIAWMCEKGESGQRAHPLQNP